MTDTPILGITEVADNQASWETTLNDGFIQLEGSNNAVKAVALTSNAATVSTSDFNNFRCFSVSGHTGTGTLTVPLRTREFSVINTSGSHATTVTMGSGATVSVAAGDTAIIQADGTDLTPISGGTGGGGGGGGGSGVGFSTDANVTATGSNQSGAYVITKSITIAGTVASSTGVRLPTWAADDLRCVVNRGANPLSVYPATGAAIEGLGTNNAGTVAVGGSAWFAADTTGLWRAF